MDIKDIKLRDTSTNVVEGKRQQQIQKYGGNSAQEQNLISPSGSDTVSFSNASRDLLRASALLEKDAEVRKGKISDIKDRIEKGLYKIDSKEVSKSLISFVADGSVV
jgi:flagellar biosynthesis anti-sigma factor FlgM